MRPIALKIQAFGSFAETEHVRFDTLAELGLFVVTGPTGSGKSTIFDAMSVALFGKVPGDRPIEVRSHHARAGLDTEVELEFEVEQRRYKVWRKPAQERERVRGTGMRQLPAEAELYEWTPAGWQGLASQHLRVTERCIDLVGLDLDQFQRVVLLPQGKFAEFLLSDTTKRQELLRQLFGSALYLQATEWYQDHARRLQTDVVEIDRIVEHHRTNARDDVREVQSQIPPETDGTLFSLGPDDLADEVCIDAIDLALQACLPQLALRHHQHEDLVAAAGVAAREAALAKESARRFDRAAQQRRERATLAGHEPEVAARAARVAGARTVVPVLAAHQRLVAAGRARAAADTAASRGRATFASGFDALGLEPADSPDAARKALAGRAAQLATQLVRLDAVVDAHSTVATRSRELGAATGALLLADAGVGAQVAERDAAQLAHDGLAERAGRLDAALAAESAAQEMAQRRRRLDELAPDLVGAHVAVDSAAAVERHLIEQFALGVAPRLAASLVGGQPCAVCGSSEHPVPARHHDGVEVVETHQLTSAREQVDSARATVTGVIKEMDLLRRTLGTVASSSVADVEAEWQRAVAAADDARTAGAALVPALARMHDATRQLAAAVEHRQSAANAVAAATAVHTGAVAALEAQQLLVHGLVDDEVRSGVAVARSLERGWPSWMQASGDLERAVAAEQAAQLDLDACVVASGHDTHESALAAGVDESEIVELERCVGDWQKQVTEVELRLRELAEQGVPEVRPDVEALTEASRVAGIDATALGQVIARIEQRCLDARRSLDRARETMANSAALRAEHDVARTVMLTTSGQLGQRIMFETWVLAAELDRVTDAASVHLQRMSAGRYTLRRGDASIGGNRRTGLDLLVFDAHTGRERVPTTLSGGERFQASLALALGLADVVSQGGTGSGRVYEALFVDEGFGSLDPDALDDAISALQHLQSAGRMVGVITHVEAMKQQLRTGIEVRLRGDGRGAMIVQPDDLASAPA